METTQTTQSKPFDLQTQLGLLGQFGAAIGSGWWAVISTVVLIYHGQFFSWVGLFMFLPGELLGLLVPVPITGLVGFFLMAVHRMVRGNASAFMLTLAAHMVVSLAAEVVVVVWFYRVLRGLVG